MSKNIDQIFIANPITTNASTDLMYFGQSPYGVGNDAAMTYTNFAAQFGAPYTASALTSANDTNVTLTLGGTPTTALLHAASITAGWTGQLSLARGGTNANLTASNGAIVYSTASAMAFSAVGSTGQVLQSAGAGTPTWSTPTYPSASGTAGKILRSDGTNNVYSTSTFADTYAVSTILYASSANTVTGLATANSAALVTNGSGVPAWQTMTAGQVLIGTTSGAPAAAAINSGTGILVQNSSGSITVSLSGTGPGTLTWNDVAGTSQAAAVNNGYIISNAGQTTVTLPATAAEGSVFAVQGKGAAGWILQANTGQVVHLGSSATSSAGSLTSTNQWDSVTIVCVTANTTFAVTSVIGNLTVA
ncbi:MAG: hypothetical protein EPO02_12740 [Nitrospirae bacterium]|nr:MAG: hypothetical protein EPO02_12740 [Nitrospirota bacterium]